MKNKKEIIQELPEEMKCLDTSDIGNWEDIIISMGIKEISEKDTNILSYIPEGNRFNIQFKNFKYLPRFNEHKGFKMLKRFLNKFYFGTYFMDVEIYESNNANVVKPYYIDNIPMTVKSLNKLRYDMDDFIRSRQYKYLKDLRIQKAKELSKKSVVKKYRK